MLILAYGVICYAIFFVTFLYAIGFVGNFGVPKSIDSGEPGAVIPSVAINCALLGLFAVQHTIMARPAFKRWWTQKIPQPIERSTFVLATCIVFALMFWQWRPLTEVVWEVDHPVGRGLIHGLFFGGFGLVLYSSFLISHFDLFGLRQVVLHWRKQSYQHTPFVMPWLYRLVRNPLMLGFIIAFWSTPVMTVGHLVFSIMTTAYILVGIQFEERDLAAALGEPYRQYRERTPMLLPLRWRSRTAEPVEAVG